MSAEETARSLYERLIEGWNAHDAEAIAPDGLDVGFDGSQMRGGEAVARELGGVFADHETATYVTKVRSVTELGSGAALLHAVAGMVPPGGSELMEDRNQGRRSSLDESATNGWPSCFRRLRKVRRPA
jgi:uncharacterized protein (TIGR02246 family)